MSERGTPGPSRMSVGPGWPGDAVPRRPGRAVRSKSPLPHQPLAADRSFRAEKFALPFPSKGHVREIAGLTPRGNETAGRAPPLELPPAGLERRRS